MASGKLPRGTPEARAGLYLGEFAGGVGQIAVGCGGFIGGGGLTATGVGSPGGVVLILGSAGLVANGVATCVVAAPQAVDAIQELLFRSDDSQPPASTPPQPPAASPPAAPPPPPKPAAPPAAKPAAPPAAPAAELKPYGGKGGGHHVPAKKAFEGAPGYDPNKALAIPNAVLKELGKDKHAK
jgi:hypothetical protein